MTSKKEVVIPLGRRVKIGKWTYEFNEDLDGLERLKNEDDAHDTHKQAEEDRVDDG